MRTKTTNYQATKAAIKKELKAKGYNEAYLRSLSMEELKEIKQQIK